MLGENGSGKSTLAKIIAGVLRADSGSIYRNRARMTIGDPVAARAAGIAMVFQELSLAPDLDAVDNMFLGRERGGRIPFILDRRSEEEVCRTNLQQLGLTIALNLPVRHLSWPQRQMLEIGKAVSLTPGVLISMSRPPASRASRLSNCSLFFRRLRDRGTAIL